MPNTPPSDAVVLRFRPMSPQGVLDRAITEADRSEGKRLYAVSVWADNTNPGETREQLIARLLAASEMRAASNAYYWECSTAQELVRRRFTFDKDGDDDEPEVHYVVVLGEPPTLDDAQRFVEAFTKETFTEEAR
ncbi:MAG: hypothetical protein WBZ15_17030 [Mycobacterium sp.]|uniref:hypothetical protein n=1 Tax=Mycobacterium sp. TaxID=1785 RepID=UPI003C66ABE0